MRYGIWVTISHILFIGGLIMFDFMSDLFSNESNRIRETNEISLKTLIQCGYIKIPRVGLCWENAFINETSNALTIDKIYDSSKKGNCIKLDTKFNIYLNHIIFPKRGFHITGYYSTKNDIENVFAIIITTDLNIKGISANSSSYSSNSEVLLNILDIKEVSEMKNGYRNLAIKLEIPPYVETNEYGCDRKVKSNRICNLLGDLNKIRSKRDINNIACIDMAFNFYVSRGYTYRFGRG